jgi:hypothetical protein
MTKNELASRLLLDGVRPDSYSLDGSTPAYEGLVLSNVHGMWLVQYFERGNWRELARSYSESDACDRFYEIVSKDRTFRQPGANTR